MTNTSTPFLIAMSGGSGSGKSTLASALLDHLPEDHAVLIGEDGYYHPLSYYGAPETDEAWRKLTSQINFDDPASKEVERLRTDLVALKAGQTIDQPVYDFDRHDRKTETRRVAPAPIILLEGIHALSIPSIAPMIDLSIYVDTPDDLRLARRIRRDVVERGRDVEDVLRQYLSTVRAAHYQFTYPTKFSADLVIADEGLPAYGKVRPGEEALERMLAPILAWLRNRGAI
ncbi:MAG: uridine kinase [Hyphomonas sp.]